MPNEHVCKILESIDNGNNSHMYMRTSRWWRGFSKMFKTTHLPPDLRTQPWHRLPKKECHRLCTATLRTTVRHGDTGCLVILLEFNLLVCFCHLSSSVCPSFTSFNFRSLCCFYLCISSFLLICLSAPSCCHPMGLASYVDVINTGARNSTHQGHSLSLRPPSPVHHSIPLAWHIIKPLSVIFNWALWDLIVD